MKYGRAVYIQPTLLVREGAKVSKYVNEVPDKDKGSLLRLAGGLT